MFYSLIPFVIPISSKRIIRTYIVVKTCFLEIRLGCCDAGLKHISRLFVKFFCLRINISTLRRCGSWIGCLNLFLQGKNAQMGAGKYHSEANPIISLIIIFQQTWQPLFVQYQRAFVKSALLLKNAWNHHILKQSQCQGLWCWFLMSVIMVVIRELMWCCYLNIKKSLNRCLSLIYELVLLFVLSHPSWQSFHLLCALHADIHMDCALLYSICLSNHSNVQHFTHFITDSFAPTFRPRNLTVLLSSFTLILTLNHVFDLYFHLCIYCINYNIQQ